MRPALPTVLITALVAVASLLDLGAPAARAQGYYYNSAQGYSYSAPPGYSYPRYNYTTQPSGYYANPPQGGSYFFNYQGSAAPSPALPAGPSRAATPVINNYYYYIYQSPPAATPPPSNSYYQAGNTRIERDGRYPNWSFDYALWQQHNM